MGWAETLAKELKSRDNPFNPAWFEGQVVSPIRSVDAETGEVSYSGPLKISCLGGEIILEQDRLCQIAGDYELYDGISVALCGALASKVAGSQKILILGVLA